MKKATTSTASEIAKCQGSSITITTSKTEPRVDSRMIAQHLGLQHESIIRVLTQYADDFRQLGILRFQIGEINGRGQPERYVLLSEDQAYLLLTYSRNTARVRKLKLSLVKAFREARRSVDVHKNEYLPTYHALHDEIARLAGGSSNERFIHQNVNKAINKVVGVASGQRQGLPMPSKAMLIVAQSMACNAMTASNNYKAGYQAVKKALQGLSQALEVRNV